MLGQFLSALLQLSIVLMLGLLFYIAKVFIQKTDQNRPSFFHYMGIQFSKNQFDRKYWIIFLLYIVFSIISCVFLFNYTTLYQDAMEGGRSPYFQILQSGVTYQIVISGIIYSFLQSGGSKELLFRGLIAKRLFLKFGNKKGNIIQAVVAVLIYYFLLSLMTGQWTSNLMIYFVGFFIQLISGYVNFRKKGEGIAPSWILHSCNNLTTLFTLAYLIS